MISPAELRDRLKTLAGELDGRTAAIYLRSQASPLFVHAILREDELWLTDVGGTCEQQFAYDGVFLGDLDAIRAICASHNTVLMELDGDLVIFRRVLDDESLDDALSDVEAAMAEVTMAGRLRDITAGEDQPLRTPRRVGMG